MKNPREEIRDKRAHHLPRHCAVRGCYRDTFDLGPYCVDHRQRLLTSGTPDKRIPHIKKVWYLTRIARSYLEKQKDHPGIAAIVRAIQELYRNAPKAKPRSPMTGSQGARYRMAMTFMHPKFDPLDILAKAAVGLAIEHSGFYRFPNPVAFQAFVGRMLLTLRNGEHMSTNQSTAVYRSVMTLAKPISIALSQAVAETFIKQVKANKEDALLLANYLIDCQTKPPVRHIKNKSYTQERKTINL